MKPNKTESTSSENVLYSFNVALLLDNAPDRELLLAGTLSLRHSARHFELGYLRAEDFVVNEKGDPLALLLVDKHDWRQKRCVAFAREERAAIRALLPISGRLFLDKDPFGRLQRFAQSIGMRLLRRRGKWTSCADAVDPGCGRDALPAMADDRPDDPDPNHYRLLIVGAVPPGCWRWTYDLARIAALPRHCGRPPTQGGAA